MGSTDDQAGEILDLAARRRQEKEVVDVEQEKTLLVIFGLHSPSPAGGAGLSGLFALPADGVEAIVPFAGATFVPGAPPWIAGVVNVRGTIESVLDLKAVLGLGQGQPTADSRLLVAHHGELRSGLLVDEMVDITEVAVAAIHAPPPAVEGSKGCYVAGETRFGSGSLLILDLAEVFHRALDTDRV